MSTDDQAERDTAATQISVCRQHAERLGWAVVDVYSDAAVSGTRPLHERPAGARLLADAAAHHFAIVLVYRLDRLGRDQLVTLLAFQQLQQCQVAVESATEHLETTTPAGRLQINLLSSIANYEREMFLQRSADATNRLAAEGAWLGGIVPFGYRVDGQKRTARLAVDESPLAGTGLSAADAVRLMYRLVADEGVSCVEVARRLNALGVPPAYVRDGRLRRHGARLERTAGTWSPSRIRNLLVNPAYKGLHVYGRRSTKPREPIERAVAVIVSVEQWERAQQALRRNQLFAPRNTKRQYLLRGLMKCAHCGLTYIGMPDGHAGSTAVWYRCNGRQRAKGLHGPRGERCPSAQVSGDMEAAVWAQVAAWLTDPAPVLAEIAARQDERTGQRTRLDAERADWATALAAKAGEADRILDLYRRGTIDVALLERQLATVEAERRACDGQLAACDQQLAGLQKQGAGLSAASELLRTLHEEMAEPPDFAERRAVLEQVVARMVVHTHTEAGGRRVATVEVVFRFAPIVTQGDIAADNNLVVTRVYAGGRG